MKLPDIISVENFEKHFFPIVPVDPTVAQIQAVLPEVRPYLEVLNDQTEKGNIDEEMRCQWGSFLLALTIALAEIDGRVPTVDESTPDVPGVH